MSAANRITTARLGLNAVPCGHRILPTIITRSMKTLESYLKQYSIDLDYWSNEMMETHETVSVREFLEENKARMAATMRERLAELDAKAKTLLDNYHGLETWDVTMLRKVVSIAYPEYRQAT